MAKTGVSKFRFISPGIQIAEIDNSQLPREPQPIGPVIIGSAIQGPALRPTKVDSFSEFVSIFGMPQVGNKGGDIWRDGVFGLAPTYGAYAAQAWLRNNSAVTFVRLLGKANASATAGGVAGWKIGNSYEGAYSTGGAFGLWLINSASNFNTAATTGTLAAVFYCDTGRVDLTGTVLGSGSANGYNTTTSSAGHLIESTGDGKTFTADVKDSVGTVTETISFCFNDSAKKYIRKVFNTNPTLINPNNRQYDSSTSKTYVLGETFDRNVDEYITNDGSTDSKILGVILPLSNGQTDTNVNNSSLIKSSTGWVISQDLASYSAFGPLNANIKKLFRFRSLEGGSWNQKNIKVSIKNVRAAANEFAPYGNFTVQVRDVRDSDADPIVLESFTNCNLNPYSDDYIGRKIGDSYVEWSDTDRRYRDYGNWTNKSKFIYVHIHSDVAGAAVDPETLPFGYYGPLRFRGFAVTSSNAITSISLKADNSGPSTDANTNEVLEQVVIGGGESSVSSDGSLVYFEGGLTQAEAEFRVTAFVDVLNTQNFTLRASNGTSHLFTVDTGIATTTGNTIGTSGIASNAAMATQIADTIIDPTSTAVGLISAVGGGAYVALTQSVGGVAGNTTITPAISGMTLDAAFAGGGTAAGAAGPFSGSFLYPQTFLRRSTEQGSLASPLDACFGLDTTRSGSSTRFYDSYVDVVGGLPDELRSETPGAQTPDNESTGPTEYQYVFTLDDVTRYSGSVAASLADGQLTSSTNAYYLSGSRRVGFSISATASAGVRHTYKNVLDAEFDQFTMPIFGGFDGVDIEQRDPFNDFTLGDVPNEFGNYAYNSVKMAIDTCADPEVIECNLMSIPGTTTSGITNHLLTLCQNRGDALGVVDIEGNFVPREDRSSFYPSESDPDVRGSVSTAVSTLNARVLNNSYGVTYYPWLKYIDENSGLDLWGPPSIAAIGTYSSAQANSELWFAPAGFTRGGLSEGAAGLPVAGVKQRLTSKDRDNLYEANINPIASFPAEGIVIFGQKTLQKTRSALDRVNVRRLMIYVKKEISRMAATLLFDQNVQITWDRFAGQVVPFLDNVMIKLGLTDFKVMLDKTTTTPDLIDRNIMYAKIYLKPARAIEFIAIDFVITNSGAAFED